MKTLSNARAAQTPPALYSSHPSTWTANSKQFLARFPAFWVPYSISPHPHSPTSLLEHPMSQTQKPDCSQAAAPPLSETCCPATGKLDWFDMIYP